MKFTCDSCGAAYMISDDKVGPGGVKVRCKKCGNVVTVRRAEEPPVVAPAAAPAAAPAGLDDELGNAFDHAFGGPSAEPPPAAAPAPEPAPSAAPAAAAIPATEWYVAIGEAQVGPLPLAEVKKKWEAGDVGPDSLVWRPGMGDWEPLSGVADLAAYLSPIPRPARPQPVQPGAVTAAAPAPAPARAVATATTLPAAPAAAAAAPEVEWKPTGASALAALASEEMATRDAASAPATPRPAPARSLIEQLPDSGGVDPTGAMPLPIRGMERTDERPVRRSSVARGAEEVRHKRTVRTIVLAVISLAAVVVAAAGAIIYTRSEPPPPAPVAAAPAAPTAAPAPTPTPAAPPAPSPAAPPADATPPASPPTEAAAAPPAKPGPAAEPAKPPAPAKEPPRAAAKATPPAAPPKAAAAPRPAPVARAEAAPAEKPATPPKKKDSVLDFDQGGEDDLAAALGGGSKGSVYVPPKPGAANLPDRLTDSQITEVVRGRVDDLRGCAAQSPGGKGTLKVAWIIQPDGTPKDVRSLTPELANSEFARCITGVVKGLRFPRIADAKGQQVTFPFGY